MKIIAGYPSISENGSFVTKVMVWPDSVLIKSGKPVFIPENGNYDIFWGVGAKITSVGKSIRKKFAGRYYNEVAPVAFLLNKEASSKLQVKHDPSACDIVEDYSVICGDFIPSDELKGNCKLKVSMRSLDSQELSGTDCFEEATLKDVDDTLNEVMETASKRNTIKTGDLVACFLDGHFSAKTDTVLSIGINHRILLENKLK